jgi:hypothetical protein
MAQSVPTSLPEVSKSLPKVFIASSGAGQPVARRIKEYLHTGGSVTPIGWWDMEAFPIGEHTLECLSKAAHECQAAVIVLTPDDKTRKKGTNVFSPRDNVVFEAGMFLSAFGRNRVAILRSRKANVLTDLDGITRLDFDLTPKGEDLRRLKMWVSTLCRPPLPDLVLNCATEAIRRSAALPVKDLHGDSIAFPFEAYPKFLERLLKDERVKIDAIEAISPSQIEYFRVLPKLGRYASTDYRNFHWFLWAEPAVAGVLDPDKASTLVATKHHQGVKRTIVVPRLVPELMREALVRYADEMRGAKSHLQFALVSAAESETSNQMILSLGSKSYRASRLVDPETRARTVSFSAFEGCAQTYYGHTIEPERLASELEVLLD